MQESRTLLMIDADAECLKRYHESLEGFSSVGIPYRLLSARTGDEAIQMARAEMNEGRRIAAVFCDYRPNDRNAGLTTIQAIHQLDAEIQFLVTTTEDNPDMSAIYRLFGEKYEDRWDYLKKPFTQAEIQHKARRLVATWSRFRRIEAVTAQLIRSERLAAVGQVARGVGHEFGNILLRIMGKTDLSLMETDVNKIHDHLEVVMSATERAGVIVRNLQSFSKAEPNRQKASIETAVDQALSLIGHEFIRCSIEVEKNYGTSTPLTLDVGALSQVFLNLFINAIFVMPKGGRLRILISEEAHADGLGGVAVRVGDTGPGISDTVLPRIFDFAFTTKGDRGSGLGLSIAREIVEAHGGTLSVSMVPEQGAEFKVWIPK